MKINLNIRKLSILSIYLATLITAKYIFGFIAGFEIVTSMFIFASMIFELWMLILLVICFNLIIISLYGLGTWWIIYWPLWIFLVTISYFLRNKITKNVLIYSIYNALWAFSLFMWFFFSDLLYGWEYAKGMLFTGMISNLVGALVNLSVSAIIFWAINDFKKMYSKITTNRY